MNVRTIIAAALIVFSLLFSNSVIAQANVSGKQPFSQSWESCSREAVDLEGWTQTVYNIVHDEAGGSHYLMKTNVKLSGVGQWGTKYHLISSFPTVAVDRHLDMIRR